MSATERMRNGTRIRSRLVTAGDGGQESFFREATAAYLPAKIGRAMRKSSAREMVEALKVYGPSDHHLVPHSVVNEYAGKTKTRSVHNKDWLLLCKNETYEQAGFLVCPYFNSNCRDPARNGMLHGTASIILD